MSLTASWYHDPYAFFTGGALWAFGNPYGIGGTSASTPAFAGIIALLNQYLRSNGQGNINANLYRLAQSVPGVFHDITTGSNIVPCVPGSPNCSTGFFGYYAGPGYDPVTGLGSVDASRLITQWNAATGSSQVVPSCVPNPVYQQPPDASGFQWPFTLRLAETAGVATTLTDFTINGTSYSTQIVNWFGTSSIPAHGTISASLGYKTLAVPITLTFGFTGVDASGRQWSQQRSVPFYGPQAPTPNAGAPVIGSVVNAASYQRGMVPGGLATIFGTHLSQVAGIALPGGATSYGGTVARVQGRQVPLLGVADVNGQEQISFQVPFDLATPATARVEVVNNGLVGAIANVPVLQAQPGIFEYIPQGSALKYAAATKVDGSVVGPSNPVSRGDVVSFFLTGMGVTLPLLQTGQAGPASPPAVTYLQPVVGIGGAGAQVLFSGYAPGFLGLYQINVVIPDTAPTGPAVNVDVVVAGTASQTSRIAVR